MDWRAASFPSHMSRSITAIVLSFVIGAAAGAGVFWKIGYGHVVGLEREVRRSKMLAEENARLHGIVDGSEKAKALAANKAQREEIERQVVAIRGLKFKTPVDYNVLTRQQIKATISGKLAEVFSEQEFKDMTAALAVLGLLPEGFPLRQKYIEADMRRSPETLPNPSAPGAFCHTATSSSESCRPRPSAWRG